MAADELGHRRPSEARRGTTVANDRVLPETRGLAERWHTVKVGMLPVAAVSSLLGIATALHWDRFNHGHVVFYAWAGLYFTLPFLVFAVWLRNRNADPRSPSGGEVILPRPVRVIMGGVGAVTCLIGLLLFLRPDVAIVVWPWELTPSRRGSSGPCSSCRAPWDWGSLLIGGGARHAPP